MTNHPPSTTKNIPIAIEKMINELSSSEEIFNTAKGEYETALGGCGYGKNVDFQYTEKDPNIKSKGRSRVRKCLWFNPPWSGNVKTDVGRQFLSILDRVFNRNHLLKSIMNRNWCKISYRTTPNLAAIISSHNKKILKSGVEDTERLCNCRKGHQCPLDGKCLSRNLIYQATVSTDRSEETYIGLTGTTFKERLANHKASHKNPDLQKSCKLANYVWKIKEKKIKYDITWKILGRAAPYSSISNVCNLCIHEKYFILYFPGLGTLNRRSELTCGCRHKNSLLIDKG